MSDFHYNHVADSIDLEFNCDNCNNKIKINEISIPEPDYSAEKTIDSQVESEEQIICDKCNKEYNIDLYTTYSGGSGTVRELSEENKVLVIENFIEDNTERDKYLYGNDIETKGEEKRIEYPSFFDDENSNQIEGNSDVRPSISKIKQIDYYGLGKDLLENYFQTELNKRKETSDLGVDFEGIYRNGRILVQIKGTNKLSYNKDNDLINQIQKIALLEEGITSFVFLLFEFSDAEFINAFKNIKTKRKVQFYFFDIDWVYQELENNSKIAEKWFKKSTPDPNPVHGPIVPNYPKIPHYVRDTPDGKDYLNFKDDVDAFAKIISAIKYQPPLAIALFGDWGSGKSFFMNKLNERIDAYSKLEDTGYQDVYCKGIAHIHFNAWSYIDSNLWASIVVRIFEGLNQYIDKDNNDDFKKQFKEKIYSELSIFKEQSNLIHKVIEKKKETINTLKIEIDEINNEKDKKAKEISDQSIGQLLKNVDEELSKTNEYKALKQEINNISDTIPVEYLENPQAAVDKLKDWKTYFIKSFNIKWYYWLMITLISFFIPLSVNYFKIEISNIIAYLSGIIAFISPFITRLSNIYKKLNPYVVKFIELNKSYDIEIKNAKEQYHRAINKIKEEISTENNKITELQKEITVINTSITELNLKAESSLQTLYSFIEEKAKGNVYSKHLGIIHTIRKDFKTLSELLADNINELENPQNNISKPEKAPLERIVLYIDDLDRCPEDKVIEVLEAVNLLMSFPLFIVVVGVDSRWVKNALVHKYKIQFGNNELGSSINPSDYLEKIFQVPFHVKKSTPEGIKKLIKNISKIEENQIVSKSVEWDENKMRMPYQHEFSFDENVKIAEEIDAKKKNNRKVTNRELETIKKEVIKNRYVEIEISEKEVKMLQDMSRVIGNNPRAIKRFVNIYHFVKSHASLKSNLKDQDILVIMFLLTLPTGRFKILYQSFIRYIHRNTELYHDLNNFIYITVQNKDEIELLQTAHNLDLLLLDNTNFTILRQATSFKFREYFEFTSRFTFSDDVQM